MPAPDRATPPRTPDRRGALPSPVATFGRAWSRSEYARFLVLEAGEHVEDAARDAGVSVHTARRAAGRRPPRSAVASLRPGTAPFLIGAEHPGHVARRRQEAETIREHADYLARAARALRS